MQTNIKQLLSRGGFIILNKRIIKELGLDVGVLLCYMIDKWGYFNNKEFYYTHENIKEDTGLGDFAVRKSVKILTEKGILINKGFKGRPPKQYYDLDLKVIESLFDDQSCVSIAKTNPLKIKPLENLTLRKTNPLEIKGLENDRVKPLQNQRVIYNNTKNINNTKEKENIFINKNIKEKENISDKDFDYLNTFEVDEELIKQLQTKNIDFGLLAVFILNRRKLKRPMTSYALKLLINKLLEFINPNVCLKNSIENGWLSVFESNNKQNIKPVNPVDDDDKIKQDILDSVLHYNDRFISNE